MINAIRPKRSTHEIPRKRSRLGVPIYDWYLGIRNDFVIGTVRRFEIVRLAAPPTSAAELNIKSSTVLESAIDAAWIFLGFHQTNTPPVAINGGAKDFG